MVAPAILSCPLSRQQPARKVKRRIQDAAAVSYGPMDSPPTVVRGAHNAAVGILASGTLLRGPSIPADVVGMQVFAQPGSTGASSSPLLSKVWGHNSERWGIASGVNNAAPPVSFNYGGDNHESSFEGNILSFQTDSDVIGVYGGAGSAALSVVMLVDEGGGFKEATYLPPAPSTDSLGGFLYFKFSSAISRHIVLRLSSYFGGVAVSSSATVEPVNLRDLQFQGALFGDSIAGYVTNLSGISLAEKVLRLLGCVAASYQGDGGTGYGQPNIGSSLTSMSGNFGTYVNGNTLNASTSRTDDMLYCSPELIVGMSGINEAIPVGGAGWDTLSAMTAVWSRLRDGAPNAVLVCVDPFIGDDGTINDGGTGSKYPALRSALAGVMDNIPGPWVSVNTFDGTWRGKRVDGSAFSGGASSAPFMTGQSTAGGSGGTDTGNLGPSNTLARRYFLSGAHPNGFTQPTTVGSPTMTGTNDTITLSNASGWPNPVAPDTSVPICIMPPGSLVDYGAAVYCTYAVRTQGANTLTGVNGYPAGVLPAGSRVFMPEYELGADVYARRIAAAIQEAMEEMR